MAQRKVSPEVPEKPPRTRPVAKTNPTTGRFRVSDQLWAVRQPLLPPVVNTHRFGGGRPRVPDRLCADGIFLVLRTGCQWKALDQTRICSGATAHARFPPVGRGGCLPPFVGGRLATLRRTQRTGRGVVEHGWGAD